MGLFNKKADDALGRSTTETMAYLTERNRRFQQFLEEKLAELAKKTVPGQTEFRSNEPEPEEIPAVVVSQAEETAMPLQGKWLGANPPAVDTQKEESLEQEEDSPEKTESKPETALPSWQDLLGNTTAVPNANEEEGEVVAKQPQEIAETEEDLEEEPLEEVDPSAWETPFSVENELQEWE